MTASAWHTRAHRIIYQQCRAEYERANRLPNGIYRKRHVPYSVPESAQFLVDMLAHPDQEYAEKQVKSYFVHGIHEGKL